MANDREPDRIPPHVKCAFKVLASFIVVPLWAVVGIAGFCVFLAVTIVLLPVNLSGCLRTDSSPVEAFGEVWGELLNAWHDL